MFEESKRINNTKPRPTQAQLTRLSNREFNDMTAKHTRKGSYGREVGCLGRVPAEEYREQVENRDGMHGMWHKHRAVRKDVGKAR